MGSIRGSLSFLIAGAAMLTLLAAAGLLFAVRTSDFAVERLTVSQRRLDLLAEASGRLTDYAFAAIDSAQTAASSRLRLTALKNQIDTVLTAAGADPWQGETIPGRVETPERMLALLRADIAGLDASITAGLEQSDSAARGDTIRGALNGFGLSAGPRLSALVEAERQAVKLAREDIARTSQRLTIAAIAAAILAILIAILLHQRIIRPLLRRISAIDDAAIAIGRGKLDTRLAVGARDELGLLVARFNRMAASLARREHKLSLDRAALERIVAERTADLTTANERLAGIDRSRRRFFADVSHELRTPLTVVLGECDIALRAPSISPEETRTTFTTIRQRAFRLHRRVEDMLRVARSESGEITLDFRRIDLARLLADTVESYAPVARRHQLEIALVLPESPGDIVADGDWIRQVIEGLIDNAIRHAKGATRIEVRLEDSPDAAGIFVSDNGCGIPAEAREQVFERFVSRNGAASSGFGIGLALAQWVIARHHGSIVIASDPNTERGTRVAITLPRAAEGNTHTGFAS
ncbi:HAMP domain-containing sensor histidine kinase [Labrys portucalensis]|uniref:histidine kinase n=1 Tax=Labrys neptuniae TaxID=376174 RepID=A0ABV6ZK82_9HYPH|nr:HAMP domain-containing sensor histidine kinase [Labrys neptuniae]MDT3380243.1 HAMP domain-containing sensor histidine kinase [Labrys neptuniae]